MKIYVLRDIKILEEEKERIKHQMLEKYRQIYVMQETFGENITKFIMRSRVIKVIFVFDQ
jgi:aspartate/tyrosine/aromatic aminotransferase